MTRDEWLETAKRDRDKIAKLIKSYHPVQPRQPSYSVPITAAYTEMACEQVRRQIRTEFEGDPVAQFDEALVKGDVNTANLILNQTWFGVPESTSCWKLEGFREAVALMEDVPYPDEDDSQPLDNESSHGHDE